jgi:hypothetical protein
MVPLIGFCFCDASFFSSLELSDELFVAFTLSYELPAGSMVE